jgi:tRNA A37 threonylcarbamoyladenosine synthetase subunit TsaC/SUA5/YrdC
MGPTARTLANQMDEFFIVDAGPTLHGIESTIVAVRNGRMELLRRDR